MSNKVAFVILVVMLASCSIEYSGNISSEYQVRSFYFYQIEGTLSGAPYSINGVSQRKYIVSEGKSSMDVLKKMYKKIYYSPDVFFGLVNHSKIGTGSADRYIELSELIDKYSSEYSIKCFNNEECKLKIMRIKGEFYKCPTSIVGKTSLEPVNLLPLKPESYVLLNILNVFE